MSQDTANDGVKGRWNAWPSWLAIAAFAIFLGLLAPQLMPTELPAQSPLSKLETKETGKLEYTAPKFPEVPSAQGMLMRLFAGTAVVLGLCVVTLWGVRRWLHPAAVRSANRELKLLETLQLGNRCTLHLVHLGKQPIVVGVDASGIKSIVPLATPFETALEEAEQGPVAEATIPFPKAAA